MQLLERTKVLLNRALKSGMTVKEIAKASGGAVPEEWLRKFRQKDKDGNDVVDNPRVKFVQALYDQLQSKSRKS